MQKVELISSYATIPSTMAMTATSGKYYAELDHRLVNEIGESIISSGLVLVKPIVTLNQDLTHYHPTLHIGWKGADGNEKQQNGSNSYGDTMAIQSLMETFFLAFDADNGKLWIARNGTYATNSSGTGDPLFQQSRLQQWSYL